MTVGIAILSLWEYPNIPKEIPASDKVLHAIMYSLLAVAWILPSACKGVAKLPIYALILVSITV